MPTLAEMRSPRHSEPPRRFLIATPMRSGGGYDGTTTDLLMALADRGMKKTGLYGVTREYGGSAEHARAYLAATFMHKTSATDLVFLDNDNSMDLETWDALMSVDGDVVGVPYIRRVEPHAWCVRIGLEHVKAPRVRRCGDERLLSVLGAGTGVLRITRDAMARVWAHFPDLKRGWEPGPYMVAVFNAKPTMEPDFVGDEETRTFRSVPRELPAELMDDYAFCERAREAGCRVEVLVDRRARHGSLLPPQTLAQSLWPDGKPPKAEATQDEPDRPHGDE